jgi:hypothetical protein
MANPTITDTLLKELRRCRQALEQYQSLRRKGLACSPSRAHAAAARATLDLSQALIAWRKIGACDAANHEPK